MNRNNEYRADPELQVEKVVQFLASLSNESKARDLATGFLVKKLWFELEHPPKTLLGFGGPNPPITVDPDLRYRSADGKILRFAYLRTDLH